MRRLERGDEYTVDQYRAMFRLLQERHKTLRAVVAAMGSRYSIATWSQFSAGVREPNYTMREELRKASGFPALGLTAEVALDSVDPAQCEVWEDGSGGPYRRVCLYAARPGRDSKLRRPRWQATLPVELRPRVQASGYTPAQLVEIALRVVEGEA